MVPTQHIHKLYKCFHECYCNSIVAVAIHTVMYYCLYTFCPAIYAFIIHHHSIYIHFTNIMQYT